MGLHFALSCLWFSDILYFVCEIKFYKCCLLVAHIINIVHILYAVSQKLLQFCYSLGIVFAE